MTPSPREVVTPLTDFARLYREHAADVHRFAVYLSGDPPLADDLVSEAFVRVWTARQRVELTTVRGYLFAIVRNLFLQHLRHERRRAPLDARIADGQPDPEVRAADQSCLQAVLAALHALPEVDRAAVLMRAHGELPYEEIAAALRISVAAAKVKVHRARLKLAEALGT
jgi:RNA polymerase sigma-70 factor (ECF subfamily)